MKTYAIGVGFGLSHTISFYERTHWENEGKRWEWDASKRTRTAEDIRAFLASHGADVFYTGHGTGVFEEVEEPSYTAIFAMDPAEEPALREYLARLARDLKQQSIALSTLDTTFIEPSPF